MNCDDGMSVFLDIRPWCYLVIFSNHFYSPAQLVRSFALGDRLDKPWSHTGGSSDIQHDISEHSNSHKSHYEIRRKVG